MEYSHDKATKTSPTWISVILVFIVLYFAFPAVLFYPLLKMEKEEKHIPAYIASTYWASATPIRYLVNNSETYEKWIDWQCTQLGVR